MVLRLDQGHDQGLVSAADSTPGPGRPAPARRPWRAALLLPLVLSWPWLAGTRYLELPPFFASLTGLLFCLLLATVSVTDLLRRRIYNWTTYTAVLWMAALQILALAAPGSWRVPDPGRPGGEPVSLGELVGAPPLADSLAGMLLGFGIMFLLFSVFRGGGGDLKLATALGTMLGPHRLLEALAYGYILAAVVGACYLVWVVGPAELLRALARLLGLLPRSAPVDPGVKERLRTRVPLGPFLTVGALAAVLQPSPHLF
jgi:Flp pilus assembly protein protease CpaA